MGQGTNTHIHERKGKKNHKQTNQMHRNNGNHDIIIMMVIKTITYTYILDSREIMYIGSIKINSFGYGYGYGFMMITNT